MTKGMDIDTRKEMLTYPDGHDPVPVTKDNTMTGIFNNPRFIATQIDYSTLVCSVL